MTENKLTFFSKHAVTCPVCDNSFYREEIFTGRGRLIAGDLTDELRRLYEPSKKYGEACPLIYTVMVCPSCCFAAYSQDFEQVPDKVKERVADDRQRRKESIAKIFPVLNFTEPRTLAEGAASYFYAIMCYDHFPQEFAPTFKRGLSALRAAWVFNDMHRKSSSENYDYLARLFYHKARFFYSLAIDREQSGAESVGSVHHFGPDLDKNYGYDGMLYIAGLLEFRHGQSEDPEKRRLVLENAKRTVSRIFGMGKASKDKPSAILDKARELFSSITEELKEEVGDAT